MAFSDCSVSDLWKWVRGFVSPNDSQSEYIPALVDVADKTLLTHVSEDLDWENAVYNN